MKTKVIIIFLLFVLHLSAQEESFKYRVTDTDGVSNIIFASQKISVGAEDNVNLKNNYFAGEEIWGRAYFTQKYGNYNTDGKDSFFLELFIDGHLIQRVTQEHPESEWGQMQVWIAGTGNDYFSGYSVAIENSVAGEHEVTIRISIKKYTGIKDILFSDGVVEKQLLYRNILLSKGSFKVIII